MMNKPDNRNWQSPLPGEYRERVHAYIQVLVQLDRILITTDWRQLDSASSEVGTVESQLRDTIYNLELIHKNEPSVGLQAACKCANNAIIYIYEFSELSQQKNVNHRMKRFEKIPACRTEIRTAIEHLQSIS
jgi:hypothetical protein